MYSLEKVISPLVPYNGDDVLVKSYSATLVLYCTFKTGCNRSLPAVIERAWKGTLAPVRVVNIISVADGSLVEVRSSVKV